MSHAIRIHQTGGPEVLRWEEVTVGEPAPGEVRLRHRAIGVNFIDTYFRSGLYPMTFPSGLGREGAGVVEAVGEGVTDLRPGDRVAYGSSPLGSYSEVRCMPAGVLHKLPEALDFETGAAMMLKGLTAAYLLLHAYPVRSGDAILIHAAAGGVGLIACQWAKALGATVIGTVSTEAKAELARRHGCDHVIDYTHEDVAARVREITGEGVAVVYDGVGKATFMASLDSLRPRGLLATFGNASGAVEPFSPLLLAQKGSLYVTRPILDHYMRTRQEGEALVRALFDIVLSGKVKIAVDQTYPLAEAAQAHRDLESRKTTGSTVLLP